MAIQIYCGEKSFTRDCRPRWLLEELGLPYEVVGVDIFAGEGRGPAYRALNPTGKVPFLRDGDAGIFESGAIVVYLGDRYGIPQLAPDLASPARAEYLQWCFFAPATMDAVATRYFANTCLFPGRPEAAERAKEQLAEFAWIGQLLERHLGARPYLLGDGFSAADILVGSALVWLDKGQGLAGYPVLETYLQRLKQRPAFARVYAPTTKEYQGYPGRPQT